MIRQVEIDLIPLAFGLVPMVVVCVSIRWDEERRRKRIRAPQTEKLLRPPGHSLHAKLDEIFDRILIELVGAFVLCALAGLCFLAFGVLSGIPAMVCFLAGIALGAGGGCVTVKVMRDVKRVRKLRLGLRGEQAVAEALQEVACHGYRSFHDIPGGVNWNIDHVCVGPPGVFLIETKARNRVKGRSAQPAHVVRVYENTLHFPNGRDTNALPQVHRNARWLAAHLTEKTGERVSVEGIVVLPGWFVDTTDRHPGRATVANAEYLKKYLSRQQARLGEAQLRRIIAVLDEKCRDIEF